MGVPKKRWIGGKGKIRTVATNRVQGVRIFEVLCEMIPDQNVAKSCVKVVRDRAENPI